MTREELTKYIEDVYGVKADFPWEDKPNYAVFRHGENRKWFAVILDIPKTKLGLPSDEVIDVLNVKCDPVLIPAFYRKKGIYPAYHMNRTYWLTVALDGSADDDTVKITLDMSYQITMPKKKAKKK